jgi:hypothetical protein
MKLYLFFFLLCLLQLNGVQAGKIYKWLDAEGIKQFSNKPPPISCRTASCLKVNKQISKKFKQRKEVALGRIEAEKFKKQEMKKKRKEQQKIQQNIPASLAKNNLSQKTFLPFSTVLCVSYNNIKEYNQVSQARKYLERDNVCAKTNEEIEYTIIEQQDEFSNIRIYLMDGSSQKKWVESRFLLEK